MKSVFPHSCQKGLAIIWPYSRRRESAYILSYQSLFSVSVNRASPDEDYPKCANEGLAETPSRGGYQKHPIKAVFCQPQLADFQAALFFPFREGGIELPTTLKRWQNPGKPGKIRNNLVPTMEPPFFLAVDNEKFRDSPLKMPTAERFSALWRMLIILRCLLSCSNGRSFTFTGTAPISRNVSSCFYWIYYT